LHLVSDERHGQKASMSIGKTAAGKGVDFRVNNEF
jgi:hypothetical protein